MNVRPQSRAAYSIALGTDYCTSVCLYRILKLCLWACGAVLMMMYCTNEVYRVRGRIGKMEVVPEPQVEEVEEVK